MAYFENEAEFSDETIKNGNDCVRVREWSRSREYRNLR